MIITPTKELKWCNPMPWGRGRARPAAAHDSQPAGPWTPPHTPRGGLLPDRCPSQFVGVSGCGCDDRFCVCGCRGYTPAVAPHATGSTPPGPVPVPVFRRQWLRLRRQVLLLRLPRLYRGGGAETAWPPSGFLFCRPFSRGAHVVEAWLVARASAITALALSALSRITTDRKISHCFLF